MKNNSSKSGKGIGIAGIVIGIAAIPSFYIPMFGWPIGSFLGTLALIFSAISLIKAGKAGASKTFGLAALILALVAAIMAVVITINIQKSNEEDLKKLEDVEAVDTLSKVIDKLEFLTDSTASSQPDSSKTK